MQSRQVAQARARFLAGGARLRARVVHACVCVAMAFAHLPVHVDATTTASPARTYTTCLNRRVAFLNVGTGRVASDSRLALPVGSYVSVAPSNQLCSVACMEDRRCNAYAFSPSASVAASKRCELSCTSSAGLRNRTAHDHMFEFHDKVVSCSSAAATATATSAAAIASASATGPASVSEVQRTPATHSRLGDYALNSTNATSTGTTAARIKTATSTTTSSNELYSGSGSHSGDEPTTTTTRTRTQYTWPPTVADTDSQHGRLLSESIRDCKEDNICQYAAPAGCAALVLSLCLASVCVRRRRRRPKKEKGATQATQGAANQPGSAWQPLAAARELSFVRGTAASPRQHAQHGHAYLPVSTSRMTTSRGLGFSKWCTVCNNSSLGAA